MVMLGVRLGSHPHQNPGGLDGSASGGSAAAKAQRCHYPEPAGGRSCTIAVQHDPLWALSVMGVWHRRDADQSQDREAS